MYTIKIHNKFNTLNFGAKISNNCLLEFAKIGKTMIANDKYDEFKSTMKEIRENFEDASINRKGGNGFCISYPKVFKVAQSNSDTCDYNISKFMKAESISEIAKLLKELESSFKQDIQLYKDILGIDFKCTGRKNNNIK